MTDASSELRPRTLSVVIPCYNEAGVLSLLRKRLVATLGRLDLPWEVLLVDDGSTDGTAELLRALHEEDIRFKVISLSRNFGHQAAIHAGLSFATGSVVAVMDADLQDPPEILAQALARLAEGFDVVYAVRRQRKETLLKTSCYALFYRMLRVLAEIDIPLDAGDFCVMTRPALQALLALPERQLFLRGMRAWVGFRQYGLEYERAARAAGQTKYPLKKLLQLATDGILAFSTVPLRLSSYLGFIVMGISIAAGLFILLWRVSGFRFMGHTAADLPGWTAIAGGLTFFSGVQLLILGLIGEYVGRIYGEVKQRPRWIVRQTLGTSAQSGFGNTTSIVAADARRL